MDKLIFFIDIDGTLASDSKVISEENKKAIAEAKAKGHLVFINTGRPLSRLPEALSTEAGTDGIITSLGATISYHGKIVHTSYSTVEDTIKIYDIAKKAAGTITLIPNTKSTRSMCRRIAWMRPSAIPKPKKTAF